MQIVNANLKNTMIKNHSCSNQKNPLLVLLQLLLKNANSWTLAPAHLWSRIDKNYDLKNQFFLFEFFGFENNKSEEGHRPNDG